MEKKPGFGNGNGSTWQKAATSNHDTKWTYYHRTPENFPTISEETTCQRLVRTTTNIKRFTTTRDGNKLILDTLEKEDNHDPTNPLYVKISEEYEEISTLLYNGVSDFGSLPRCTTIGCPLHSSPVNTPNKSPPNTPTHTQKHNNDGFISPPARKTAKRVLLETTHFTPLNLENRFTFPTIGNASELPSLPNT
ncbi:hypothetical protein TNCV_4914811 [Trichonephila clavipes]|nr:hypothetical protein TNCV_4914811 [Trichonephila clavipes]